MIWRRLVTTRSIRSQQEHPVATKAQFRFNHKHPDVTGQNVIGQLLIEKEFSWICSHAYHTSKKGQSNGNNNNLELILKWQSTLDQCPNMKHFWTAHESYLDYVRGFFSQKMHREMSVMLTYIKESSLCSLSGDVLGSFYQISQTLMGVFQIVNLYH